MKFLYVTTISGTMGFFKAQIAQLQREGHTVELACNTRGREPLEIGDPICRVFDIGFSRSPASRGNLAAYKELKKIISRGHYDIIHTHTPVASSLVRLAARGSGAKILYTAHGFHFYKGAPIKNWLVYYPIEKWLSRYTDVLITINREDYGRAKRRFKAKNVAYVPGVGLKIDNFRALPVDRQAQRADLGLPGQAFVLLSVGEVNQNKNHELVIRALAGLNDPYIHYVICGKGPLETTLQELAQRLGVSANVHLMGFRTDVAQIYQISDLFVFPSFREGLPVSLMEAMASGLPALATNIRGNTDLIDPGFEQFLFDPHDVTELEDKLKALIKDPDLDAMIKTNQRVIHQFGEDEVLSRMARIYSECIQGEDVAALPDPEPVLFH